MTALITNFYSAFKVLDAEKMIACYHDKIEFEDPAFGKLSGNRAKKMWKMLCENAIDFEIEFSNINMTNDFVTANWEAKYTFSQTGKTVHNIIEAKFEFKDGRIIKHTDNFNLHKWASQALGFKGWLLGNTSFFKSKLQQQTGKLLDNFEQNNI